MRPCWRAHRLGEACAAVVDHRQAEGADRRAAAALPAPGQSDPARDAGATAATGADGTPHGGRHAGTWADQPGTTADRRGRCAAGGHLASSTFSTGQSARWRCGLYRIDRPPPRRGVQPKGQSRHTPPRLFPRQCSLPPGCRHRFSIRAKTRLGWPAWTRRLRQNLSDALSDELDEVVHGRLAHRQRRLAANAAGAADTFASPIERDSSTTASTAFMPTQASDLKLTGRRVPRMATWPPPTGRTRTAENALGNAPV